MSNLQQFLPFLILLVGLGFLLYLSSRSRRRMAEQTQRTQDALSIGTPVTMTCGLYGTVSALQEKTLDVQVAPGIDVRFLRQAVLEVRKDSDTDSDGQTADDAGTDETPSSSE